jgi:hypothetical protein
VRIAGISGDGGGEDCRGNSSGDGAGVMIVGIGGESGAGVRISEICGDGGAVAAVHAYARDRVMEGNVGDTTHKS